ncbi:MAG: Rpn family recombination-promoting nuclease/putative transposase [Magnetococcales bacterium]|nr:Rpn family recombination-promoting nuclease/putative transposase [Magnetococcales bacterium]NGZ07596.1 Rpn family recombination-promoting nuclease/putative transposase [Magnetococcales bacterium]
MTQRRLITFDWALKRLLRSKANFDVLEGLLSELLMTDVQILEILESESNQDHALDRYNRVDMKVRNSQGEPILIELQYEREHDYLHRLVYASSKTIVEHLHKGDAYSKIPKLISISILYFDLGQGQDYIYHGTTAFRGLHLHDELQLNEGQKSLFRRQTVREIFPEYYLLKVNLFDEIARTSLDEWICFLKTGEIREEFSARGLSKAKELFDILNLPEAERQAYERYQEDLHFQASMVESTYGAGLIEGKKVGIQIGEQKGKADMLLQLVQARFGPVPESIQQQVLLANLDELTNWSRNIFTADSLQTLFRGQPKGLD